MLFVFYVPELGNIILGDFFKKFIDKSFSANYNNNSNSSYYLFVQPVFFAGIWPGRFYMY